MNQVLGDSVLYIGHERNSKEGWNIFDAENERVEASCCEWRSWFRAGSRGCSFLKCVVDWIVVYGCNVGRLAADCQWMEVYLCELLVTIIADN